MRFDELRRVYRTARRKKPDDDEHRLQCACVKAFRYKYPKLRHNLFAVPNGGRRDKITGARLKAEGVVAGVSDLILLKSSRHYGALLIEMKTPKGRQQESQKEWERLITADGYKYVVCRSVKQFLDEIGRYLVE